MSSEKSEQGLKEPGDYSAHTPMMAHQLRDDVFMRVAA